MTNQEMRIRPAEDRGVAEFGWLSSRHSFGNCCCFSAARVQGSDKRPRMSPGGGNNFGIFIYSVNGAASSPITNISMRLYCFTSNLRRATGPRA